MIPQDILLMTRRAKRKEKDLALASISPRE